MGVGVGVRRLGGGERVWACSNRIRRVSIEMCVCV